MNRVYADGSTGGIELTEIEVPKANPELKEVEPPKANPERIAAIIENAYVAKIALPDFQRNFIWPRESIEELLSSILQGYFIGTFLFLDTQTENPLFPALPIAGLNLLNPSASPKNHTTIRLVLDGQQRITAIFYALYQPDIPLKNAKYPHKFYLRLDMALNGNIDESVVGISVMDRRGTAEIQQLVKEDMALPFTVFRDQKAFNNWLFRKQTKWGKDREEEIQSIYSRIQNFMVPVVELKQGSSKANIINIFERINRTGVGLTLFELAVARLYMKGINLKELWDFYKTNQGREIVKVAKPEFFIKLIAIFQGKEPRKGNLLDIIGDMDAETFKALWTRSTEAMIEAYNRIKEAYGAFDEDWIPYTTIIVPLAYLLYEAKKMGANTEAYGKIDRWYWASVLSQRYNSAVETKTYQDAKGVLQWIQGKGMPDWIGRTSSNNIEMTIDEPESAIYKGLMGLVVHKGARDFLTGQPAKLSECQDDHIFPRSEYEDDFPVDKFLNRTLISIDTNGPKGKWAEKPSIFMQRCLKNHLNDEKKLMETLESHLISRQAYEFLKIDDFNGFITERERTVKAILDSIFSVGNPLTPVNPSPIEEESSSDLLSTPIVGPSEESDNIAETKKEWSERNTLILEFWTCLLNIASKKTNLHAKIKPGRYRYIQTSAGIRGLKFHYVVNEREGIVDLYIDRGKEGKEKNKAVYDALYEKKHEIERIFGGPLEWQRMETSNACRIGKTLPGGYRDDKKDWPRIQESMIDAMVHLSEALKPYIEKLNPWLW